MIHFLVHIAHIHKSSSQPVLRSKQTFNGFFLVLECGMVELRAVRGIVCVLYAMGHKRYLFTKEVVGVANAQQTV